MRDPKGGLPACLFLVLQGPIDDAFLDPFLMVRLTGTPWSEEKRHLGRTDFPVE